MQSSRRAFSIGAALYRTFVAPIGHAHHRPTETTHQTTTAVASQHPITKHQRMGYKVPAEQPKPSLPRDKEITDRMILLVNEDTTLTPPQYTAHVLRSIDPATHTLRMVAQPSEHHSGDARDWPICKIMEKKALFEMGKTRAKKKENPSTTLKTVELSWAIDAHDLAHRLERLRAFLAKGFKVDVVLAHKKRKARAVSDQEVANVIASVKRAMAEVEGSKEWKPMEGRLGGLARLFVEGKKAAR